MEADQDYFVVKVLPRDGTKKPGDGIAVPEDGTTPRIGEKWLTEPLKLSPTWLVPREDEPEPFVGPKLKPLF